jgi:hypothetical protein
VTDSALGLRRWFRGLRSRSTSSSPFTVVCRCGSPIHGRRRRRSQVLPCPACGRPIFVLARSPYLDRSGSRSGGLRGVVAAPSTSPATFRLWRLPLYAAAATITALVIAFMLLAPLLSRPAPEDNAVARLESARRALDEGSFHRARAELEAADRECRRRPDALPRTDQLLLDRLMRQTQLLDNLLSESLQDLLGQASATRREDEWRRRFQRDYKGLAVLFDDEVGLDAAGRPTLLSAAVEVGEERARVALEDLTVLRKAPLDAPQRVLFGGRLARFERDGDSWVIGFDPDSGVLFTDAETLAAWRPMVVDAELREVLKRQLTWTQPAGR